VIDRYSGSRIRKLERARSVIISCFWNIYIHIVGRSHPRNQIRKNRKCLYAFSRNSQFAAISMVSCLFLEKRHPNPIPTRRLKLLTYPWLHLSFDRYFFQQLSRSPQPPYQLHRQLYLSWPPPPVHQIHTQKAQAHSPLITYPPAAVFFLCTCFSLLYL
jgi:hypothetical protein